MLSYKRSHFRNRLDFHSWFSTWLVNLLSVYQAIVIFGLAFVVNPFEKGFEELTPLQRVIYIEGICWLTTLFIYSLYRIAFPIKKASSSFFIFNKHPKSKIKNHARICKRRGAIRQKTQLTINEGLLWSNKHKFGCLMIFEVFDRKYFDIIDKNEVKYS